MKKTKTTTDVPTREELLAKMPETYDTITLAARWHLKPETIEAWRYRGKGPKWHKVGRGERAKVIYYREDVLDYEQENPTIDKE